MTKRAARVRKALYSQGTVIDLAGLPVDASGRVWRLHSFRVPIELDWATMPISSPDILDATRSYVARLIRSKSPDAVRNTFENLKLLGSSKAFRVADESGDEIPEAFFGELRQQYGHAMWRLHYARHWYRSCADMGHVRFSPEVAFELEGKTIGGNKKGQAVLSLHPEEGPLNDLEITGLLNAMNAHRRSDHRHLEEMAALWLCIAFGSNPLQIALLREEDVEVIEADGRRFVQVRMPRIKKRTERPRMEFRVRKLPSEIGDVLLELIAENRRRRVKSGWDNRHAFPLFVRFDARERGDDPMVEYARHLYADEISALVRDAVDGLGVVSPRTGKPLRVTCRRLRYTFATRLVREGASRHAVADALDHTDLQHVGVYFDIKSDIVESLDKAMALALGPVAQAFLGKLVGSEAAAERGDDPRSRIMARDRSTGEGHGLGTCGEYSFCGRFAPIACYTCHQFQPWMDGPHDKILDDLLTERERRVAAGQDGRMASLHDATILAVGDVISRIEAMRSEART